MRHAFLRKINHFVIIVNLLSFTYTGSDRCEKLERDRGGRGGDLTLKKQSNTPIDTMHARALDATVGE